VAGVMGCRIIFWENKVFENWNDKNDKNDKNLIVGVVRKVGRTKG
jgi:hypothetical protein